MGLPNNLLSSVCYIETNHKNVITVEKNGHESIGVCQIKLSTAQKFDKDLKKEDLKDPKKNIYYAGLYLQSQYKRYNNWARAVNAYNRGFSESNKGSEYVNKVFNRMIEEKK